MKRAPTPENESLRLDKLHHYQILDTSNETKFDQITKTIANVCNTKIALISLLDRDRQWFKSKFGLNVSETPRDISFCGHAIMGDDIFEIADAELDERFCDNPLFLNEPNVRFYAGMPLITADNFRLGTLCVIDSVAKQLTEQQKNVLRTFAQMIVELLELNLKNKSLLALNQQYSDVQNMVQAGAWELDLKTEITFWSEQVYQIYKIPPGTPTNKIDGLSFYAPHEREKLSRLLSRCVLEGQSFDEVFEFYDSEGSKKWVRSIGRAVVNAEDVATKVVGTFQDVTSQVEKEKELEFVMANITEGYFDWKINENYEYMSPRFWQILGYRHQDKKHHPSEWQKIIHPDDLESAMGQFDLHVRTRGAHPYGVDVRYLHQNGEYRWIRCQGKVVEWGANGEALRMVGTHQDIHDAKKNASEAAIIKFGIESIAIVSRTDRAGLILYANDLFCQISKYTEQELIGSNHSMLASGHHPKRFFTEMWGTILSKKIWRNEIKNKAKDGSFYWVDTTIIPMTSVVGEIEGFLSFRYDITERKISELALKESENKHKQLFIQSQDAVMTLSPPTWLFTSCNQMTLKLFKLNSESEFVKLGPWDVSPKYQPTGELSSVLASHAIQMAMESGSHYFNWLHQTVNGEPISCTVLLSRIHEGGEVYLQATVRDVSIEKQLQDKLGESNKYLDLAIEGANLGIWDWYLTDNKVKYSERWARLRGLELSDLKMDITDWESRVHPDDLPIVYGKINDYINRKSTYFEHIHRIKHQNGNWIYILGRGRFSDWDQTGKPLRFTGTDIDVTDMMSNKLKLDLFFKKAPYGFAFCDMDGKFIEINDELTKITGFSKIELNQRTLCQLSPDSSSAQEAQIRSLHEKGFYGPYSKELIRKDGGLVSVNAHGFIVEDYDGRKGVWSIIEDVSLKVKLEKERNELLDRYHKLSEKLEAIFSFSPVVVYECLINQNWTMNFINAYIENISGYTSDDLISDKNISFVEIIHPDDREYVDRKVNEAVVTDSGYSINYRIKHKSGEIRWVWEQGAKVPHSDSLIGVIIDITERKKSEEISQLLSRVRSKFIELSHDKTKFFECLIEMLLAQTSSEYGFIGEILEDINGKYLKTLALTNISWDEVSKKLYQENSIAGFEFRNLDSLFGEVIKTGKLLIANDAPAHPKAAGIPTGHPPLKRFMGIPISYNDEVFAMVGIANNESGYKVEDYNYLKPFFELIGEMIKSIHLNSELELQKKISFHNAKLASIGELAAGVGHEINNPLAIILAQLEMMKMFCEKKGIKYDEIDSKIAKSLKSVDRISNIVKGLRSFSRGDEDAYHDLNLSDLLLETKDMLCDLFSIEGVDLSFDVAPEIQIKGNRGRLQQVFINILNNAKDALADAAIKKIHVKAFYKENHVEIRISDTGPGVPANIRDKIFDPFFTTKEVNKGTGIGLALVSSITKEHNGMVSLDVNYKNGACFVISLPMSAQHKLSLMDYDKVTFRNEITAQSMRPTIGKVLIVEDEEDLLEVMKAILEMQGLEVMTASNGLEANNYIMNHYSEIDLIISDMKMPGMSGPELVQAIQQFGKYKGHFIFMTGGLNVSLDDYKGAVQDIIPKPFNREDIRLVINKWLPS
jgi:PAS domain S-box-containing protein